MKRIIYMLCILISACTYVQYENEPQVYDEVELSEWVNGYQAEVNEPNYTDNQIYNECLEVVFEYRYQKDSSIKYYEGVFLGDWSFVDKGTLDGGIGIKQIKLTAINPNDIHNAPPQSSVQYELFNAHGQWISTETTSVIENHSNIVLHNTRTGFFGPLFIFPWPSVKFPIEENLEWKWKFAYGSGLYGDDRLYNWDGITEMNYTYKFIGNETLSLDFGTVATSKFEAIGTDGIIENKLVYNFNSKMGFVKQVFHTHDGATVELVAVDYNNLCDQ